MASAPRGGQHSLAWRTIVDSSSHEVDALRAYRRPQARRFAGQSRARPHRAAVRSAVGSPVANPPSRSVTVKDGALVVAAAMSCLPVCATHIIADTGGCVNTYRALLKSRWYRSRLYSRSRSSFRSREHSSEHVFRFPRGANVVSQPSQTQTFIASAPRSGPPAEPACRATPLPASRGEPAAAALPAMRAAPPLPRRSGGMPR